MKICPFMSHMLGNEANILEVGMPEDLSRTDEAMGGVAVKTERKSRTDVKKESKPATSHLYCLRDTCRFYRGSDGGCTFDAILENASRAGEEGAAAQKEAVASFARELDKFWKFQTKSAAELIASFGEVEKRQEESLSKITHELESRLQSHDGDEMNSIRDNIAEIKDTIDVRNDGFEALTTTVSDLVVGFDDSFKAIKEQWKHLSEQMATLEAMAPRIERMESTTR